MGAQKELDRWAGEAEAAAERQDPLALAKLYRLANLSRLVPSIERTSAALGRILASPKIDPLTRAHARILESAVEVSRGHVEDAKRIRSEIGLVTSALILGPFDNSAGGGHDEPYPPETKIDLDEPVPGRDRPIRWRHTKDSAQLGLIELSQLVHPGSDATAYVLVSVEADRETKAALRTGSSGPIKAFFGGRMVLEKNHERSAELDQDVAPIVVPQGKTALLIKSSWTGKDGTVVFRLTAPDGAPLKAVKVSSDRTDIAIAIGNKRQPPVGKHAVVSVTDAIDRAIANAKGQDEAAVLALRSDLMAVLELYDARKLPIPPVNDLDRAIRVAPDQPLLRFLYALRVEKNDPSTGRDQLEAALASDPKYAPSLLKLARIAEDSGRKLEARGLLEKALAYDPSFDAVRLALTAHRQQSRFERELALYDLESTPEPSRSPEIWTALAKARFDLGDRKGAMQASERALARDFAAIPARDLMIDLAVDAGRIDLALAKVEEAISIAPHLVAPRLRRIRMIAAGGQPDSLAKALAELDELAGVFPDSTAVASLQSELFLRSGDKAKALAQIDRTLEIDPHQRDARRHRAAISGESAELEDQHTANAESLIHRPVSKLEEGWGATYLLDRTVVRLYDNGKSSRFVQTVLRLQKAELRDLVRADQIRYSPSREVVEVLSAERIRPSGEVIKASRINDQGPGGKVGGMYLDQRWKNVEFDDLEPGDLIHLRYRLDSIGQNMFGGFFGDETGVRGRLPIERYEYTAIAPASRPLHPGMSKAPPPQVTVEGGVQKISWTFDSVPPIETEPMAPPYADLGMTLGVSTYERWEELGRWYSNLFRDQMELDQAAREAGKQAVKGAKDDAEKIRRLHSHVVKSTRYVGIELGIHGWKPFKASEVHRRRYGDCKDKATLLAALLRDNGIEATIALVRTWDRGSFPANHATMWAFNHAITYIPSADLYLDGTAEFAGTSELPYQDQGAFVLVVWPDGKTKLDSPPESAPAENLNQSQYTSEILADGTLRLEGEERFFGARAAALRQEYEEPRTRIQLVEKSISQVAPGAQVTGVEFSDLSDLDRAPSYRYGAVLPRYASVAQGRIILPLTLFPHQVTSAYGSLAEREHDLFINYPWSTRNIVRYRLPEGAEIELLPEGVQVDTPYISLDQRINRVDGGYETDDTVTFKTRRVPASAYQEFRESLLKIDRALERKVVVRK
jgi:cellulose synthase operon protein C